MNFRPRGFNGVLHALVIAAANGNRDAQSELEVRRAARMYEIRQHAQGGRSGNYNGPKYKDDGKDAMRMDKAAEKRANRKARNRYYFHGSYI